MRLLERPKNREKQKANHTQLRVLQKKKKKEIEIIERFNIKIKDRTQTPLTLISFLFIPSTLLSIADKQRNQY
jgi:hypothetical protein